MSQDQPEKVFIVGQGSVEKDPVTKSEKLTPAKITKKDYTDDPFKSSNEIKRTFYVKEETQPSILDIQVRPGKFVSKLP